jgi:ubiquinone/menaquinone biosynthesis C-methylase UbiE
MSISFGPGFHAPAHGSFDAAAYDQYLGRWSKLFVPAVLAAAEVAVGDRVLDVATGPGEAAMVALGMVKRSGFVVGADIAPAMLLVAKQRAKRRPFLPVAADGQALPLRDASFDAVVCQLGLQFFADPARGLGEFRRVLRAGRRAAVCVLATADRAPMWGELAEALSRRFPDQRNALNLSFSLADADRLERMFNEAGFHDVQVSRTRRQGIVASFEAYWASVAAGSGVLPQAYRALSEPDRLAVQQEVQRRLSPLASRRGIAMSFEMLIGAGRA